MVSLTLSLSFIVPTYLEPTRPQPTMLGIRVTRASRSTSRPRRLPIACRRHGSDAVRRSETFRLAFMLSWSTYGVNVFALFLVPVSRTSVSLLWLPFRGATNYHVERDGVTIYSGPQTSTFVDRQGLQPGTQYEYAMYADFSGTPGTTSPATAVFTLDTSVPEGESRCASDSGYTSELSYQPNSDKTWRIAPTMAFEFLTLRVSTMLFYLALVTVKRWLTLASWLAHNSSRSSTSSATTTRWRSASRPRTTSCGAEGVCERANSSSSPRSHSSSTSRATRASPRRVSSSSSTPAPRLVSIESRHLVVAPACAQSMEDPRTTARACVAVDSLARPAAVASSAALIL